MRERKAGRILITGSVAGSIPGSYHAVYNATKAFLENFSYGLRDELSGTGVTVTCLMPGPTDTEFFERAGMEETPVGQDQSKADPAKVARDGYEAMKQGEAGIVSGFMNKVQALFAGVIPPPVLAQMHRRMAEPRGGEGDAEVPGAGGGPTRPDKVEEASRDSFPASDPPAYNPARSGVGKRH